MIKMLLAFLVVFFAFYFGISAFRRLTGKEKLAYTKLYLYSLSIAVLAIGLLTLFVVLF
jgi:hypothetical protein